MNPDPAAFFTCFGECCLCMQRKCSKRHASVFHLLRGDLNIRGLKHMELTEEVQFYGCFVH